MDHIIIFENNNFCYNFASLMKILEMKVTVPSRRVNVDDLMKKLWRKEERNDYGLKTGEEEIIFKL